MTRPEEKTVAAVDLGSNSFHLVVGQAIGNKVRVIDRLKERVALAEGLDADRNLDAASQDRALACLHQFGDRLRGLPEECVRAAGTNTLRAARNGDDFRREAEAALGHRIDVISGTEEARLVYFGVAHTRAPDGRRRAVIDVGGGSTEVVAGDGFDVLRGDSLRMGCVTFTRGFFPGGEINEDRLNAVRFAASVELEAIATTYRELEPQQWIGSSGTMLAVEEIISELGEGPGIHRAGLALIRQRLLDAGHIDEVDLPGLSESRRPVIAGGFGIVEAVVEAFNIERLETSEGALREGLLYDLIDRTRGDDPREDTIRALMDRFRVDAAQAERVEATLAELVEPVAGIWALDEPLRRAGAWAARLHEIGLAFRHAGYHKHGAYLLENSDLPGFSQHEQQLLAALVLCHRRKFRAEALEVLGADLARGGVRMAALLRLAVRLHRSRTDRETPKLGITVRPKKKKKDQIDVEFPSGWLEAHPLVRVDLEAEKERLERGNIELSFR